MPCEENNSLDYFTPGDTLAFTLTVTDGEGNPYNLDGCKIYFTLKKDLEDEVPFFQATAIQENPGGNTATVEMPPSDSENAEPGIYYYDFRLITGSGDVLTYGSDVIECKDTPTKKIT